MPRTPDTNISADLNNHLPLETNQTNSNKTLENIKSSALNAAIYIAITTGLFLFSGTMYLEEYYSLLNIPFDLQNIPTDKKITYGSISYLALITVLLILSMIIAIPIIISLPFKNNDKPLPNHTRKILSTIRTRRKIFNPCIIAISLGLLSALLWKVSVLMPQEMARKNAVDFINNCNPAQFIYKNGDKISACYITESPTTYYTATRTTDNKCTATFTSLHLPKEGIKLLNFPDRTITRLLPPTPKEPNCRQ